MVSKVKERVKTFKTQPQKEPCRHYWVIEVANGPVSRGQCKFCGERKEFFNAFPEFNPLKKNTNPIRLPELPAVEVDEDSESTVPG
jgi:hypothetical protein